MCPSSAARLERALVPLVRRRTSALSKRVGLIDKSRTGSRSDRVVSRRFTIVPTQSLPLPVLTLSKLLRNNPVRTTKPYGVVRGDAFAAGDGTALGEAEGEAAGEAAAIALFTGVPP